MITAFKERKIDVAIALTEALIAGIALGKGDYKFVGTYVLTPLNWSVGLPPSEHPGSHIGWQGRHHGGKGEVRERQGPARSEDRHQPSRLVRPSRPFPSNARTHSRE